MCKHHTAKVHRRCRQRGATHRLSQQGGHSGIGGQEERDAGGHALGEQPHACSGWARGRAAAVVQGGGRRQAARGWPFAGAAVRRTADQRYCLAGVWHARQRRQVGALRGWGRGVSEGCAAARLASGSAGCICNWGSPRHPERACARLQPLRRAAERRARPGASAWPPDAAYCNDGPAVQAMSVEGDVPAVTTCAAAGTAAPLSPPPRLRGRIEANALGSQPQPKQPGRPSAGSTGALVPRRGQCNGGDCAPRGRRRRRRETLLCRHLGPTHKCFARSTTPQACPEPAHPQHTQAMPPARIAIVYYSGSWLPVQGSCVGAAWAPAGRRVACPTPPLVLPRLLPSAVHGHVRKMAEVRASMSPRRLLQQRRGGGGAAVAAALPRAAQLPLRLPGAHRPAESVRGHQQRGGLRGRDVPGRAPAQ